MTSQPVLRSVVAAGMIVLTLGACGSDSPEAGGGAGQSKDAPAGGATVDQIEVKDFAYKPEKATVKVGTKVTWNFQDSAAHNVEPVGGGAEPAKSPDLKTGGTYSFTFTKPGMVSYRCGIHNYMTASVMVIA